MEKYLLVTIVKDYKWKEVCVEWWKWSLHYSTLKQWKNTCSCAVYECLMHYIE